MPPYVELVKLDGLNHLDDPGLLRATLALLRTHLERRPATNPIARFRKRLEHDLEWLCTEDIDTFHLYAFATLRRIRECG